METLLKNAEAAVLQAKAQGRNRFAFFTEELNDRIQQRFDLEFGLSRALDNREFEIYYQPRLDAASSHINGAEALIRWRRDGSLISPNLFIPVLEDMGLILPVGKWVLRSACRQCRQWHEQGYREMRVAVNVSMAQVRSGSLLNDVRTALIESGLDARFLELELTESLLSENSEQTTRLLHDLKRIGTYLSIDDFGTGYSSLSYLMNFPIDYLKIDQSFVRDATTNRSHANLTRTIVAMAKSLDIKTVAEGIENTAQWEFLRNLDCDELQGFLFSPPLPETEFLNYLGKGDRLAVAGSSWVAIVHSPQHRTRKRIARRTTRWCSNRIRWRSSRVS